MPRPTKLTPEVQANLDDLLKSDLSWVDNPAQLETTDTVSARTLKAQTRLALKAALRKEKAAEIFNTLPTPGESLHAISNGSFDYFNLCSVFLDHIGGHTDAFYGSTWTMSRPNVLDLLKMYDDGKIGAMAILTGVYFKRRESAVYATLLEGLQARGQRFIAFENHAKVMLLNSGPHYLAIEGSANFTANPRLEQTVITNSYDVWEFHRDWMEAMFHAEVE